MNFLELSSIFRRALFNKKHNLLLDHDNQVLIINLSHNDREAKIVVRLFHDGEWLALVYHCFDLPGFLKFWHLENQNFEKVFATMLSLNSRLSPFALANLGSIEDYDLENLDIWLMASLPTAHLNVHSILAMIEAFEEALKVLEEHF